MPVQLDWEIDDVEKQLPDSPSQAGTGPRGCLRWWRFVVLISLAVVVALGFLGLKLRQQQSEAEGELRDIVQIELNAFINGDLDLFIGRQDPSDARWARIQEDQFRRYHQLQGQNPWQQPVVPEYTGEIPVVRVGTDNGWALVEVGRGERVWRELWFYRWNQDDGWNRTRLDADWLGEERERSMDHLHFIYPQRDEAVVDALAHKMEAWYHALAPVFDIEPSASPIVTVVFSYRNPSRSDAPEIRWKPDGTVTLRLRSPHQGRLSADAEPSLELRKQMADYLVQAIIAQRAGVHPGERYRMTPPIEALRDEVRDWAISRLKRGIPHESEWGVSPTPLLDHLVARDGVQIIKPLTTNLRHVQTLDEALSAAGLDPIDAATRVAFFVAAVDRAYFNLDERSYQELMDPKSETAWHQYTLDQLRERREDTQADQLLITPESIRITSLVLNSDIVWVETETTSVQDTVLRQTRFFRQVGPDWMLTSPDPAYFGERRTARTENLEFHYFEREADWFEERIPTALQAVISQAASDLGISTDSVSFAIETDLQPGVNGFLSADGELVRFTSPLITGWQVDHADEQVMYMALPLLSGMFETMIQDSPDTANSHFLIYVAAFVWELERLFPQRLNFETLLGRDVQQAPRLSLIELWSALELESLEGIGEQSLVFEYRALIEFLSERYGPQVVPMLLTNVSRTDDLDELLRLSVGYSIDEVEPAWREWLLTAYEGATIR